MQITLQGENNKTDRRNWRISNGSRASRQARIQKEFFALLLKPIFRYLVDPIGVQSTCYSAMKSSQTLGRRRANICFTSLRNRFNERTRKRRLIKKL